MLYSPLFSTLGGVSRSSLASSFPRSQNKKYIFRCLSIAYSRTLERVTASPFILASEGISPPMQTQCQSAPVVLGFNPPTITASSARFLASKGIPQDRIADVVGVSPKTLRKHPPPRTLYWAPIEANMAVLKVLQ